MKLLPTAIILDHLLSVVDRVILAGEIESRVAELVIVHSNAIAIVELT